jgi:hypothetical protein
VVVLSLSTSTEQSVSQIELVVTTQVIGYSSVKLWWFTDFYKMVFYDRVHMNYDRRPGVYDKTFFSDSVMIDTCIYFKNSREGTKVML